MDKALSHCTGKFIKINGLLDTVMKTGESCRWHALRKIISWNVDTVRGVTKTKMKYFLGKN